MKINLIIIGFLASFIAFFVYFAENNLEIIGEFVETMDDNYSKNDSIEHKTIKLNYYALKSIEELLDDKGNYDYKKVNSKTLSFKVKIYLRKFFNLLPKNQEEYSRVACRYDNHNIKGYNPWATFHLIDKEGNSDKQFIDSKYIGVELMDYVTFALNLITEYLPTKEWLKRYVNIAIDATSGTSDDIQLVIVNYIKKCFSKRDIKALKIFIKVLENHTKDEIISFWYAIFVCSSLDNYLIDFLKENMSEKMTKCMEVAQNYVDEQRILS